jgi:MFS family permease
MFLTLGLGVGLGNGLTSCPMLAVMSPYFSTRRGLAIGITMCGSCTGGLVYSAIMRQLIPKLGFSLTMRVIALIQLVTLGMANVCLRPRIKGKKIAGWVDWTAFQDVRFQSLYHVGLSCKFDMPCTYLAIINLCFLVLARSLHLHFLRRGLL